MSEQKVIKLNLFKERKKENPLGGEEGKIMQALHILGRSNLKSLSVAELRLAGEVVDKTNGALLLSVIKKTGIKTIPKIIHPYPRLAWMYLYMLFTKAVSWKTPGEIEEAFPFTEDIDNELAYMTPEELHKEYGEENFDGSIYKAQDFMFDMQNKLLTAISFSFFIQLRGLSEYPSSIIESKAFPEDMREFLHIYQEFANNDVSIGEDSEVAEDEKKESKETEKPKLHPVR